jgi:DNA-binding transcriptional LysR family regulator
MAESRSMGLSPYRTHSGFSCMWSDKSTPEVWRCSSRSVPSFAEKHPSINLRVSATLHHVDFAREDVELALRHGDGNWPGLAGIRLGAGCSLSVARSCARAAIA